MIKTKDRPWCDYPNGTVVHHASGMKLTRADFGWMYGTCAYGTPRADWVSIELPLSELGQHLDNTNTGQEALNQLHGDTVTVKGVGVFHYDEGCENADDSGEVIRLSESAK